SPTHTPTLRADQPQESTSRKHAGLETLTLQDARHTYSSLMIEAGANAKALTTYMGHASITITYDRYGHLMPGNEHHAANLLNTLLQRASQA
ncbi:MAG: tyrosine-type recombinase/integrase, partial [Actinomycetia bacterium]|nr:tyrosine-type recombinase/integrase [Actinomycetes bacterium]